jgi:hypothetical protein
LKIHGRRDLRVKNLPIVGPPEVLEEGGDMNPIPQPGTDNVELREPIHDVAPCSVEGRKRSADKSIRVSKMKASKIGPSGSRQNIRRGWESVEIGRRS